MRHHQRIAARAARSVSSRKGLTLSVALGLAAVPVAAFAPLAAAAPGPCVVSINGGAHTPYANLQGAVNAAGSLTNPTLRLYSNCTGDTAISASMVITGGPLGATLHGVPGDSVVSVISGTVTLANLDITGGTGHATPNNGNGGPVGGGIYNVGSLTLNNVTVRGNSAYAGGGIWNVPGSQIWLGGSSGTSVNHNTATYGGGIFDYQAVDTATKAQINANTATAGGGGIFEYQASATLGNTSITGNTNTAVADKTQYGGGGIAMYQSTVSLPNSNVNNNTSGGPGGGIANQGGSLSASHASIKGNTATTQGGGVWNYGGTLSFTTSVTVSRNTALASGGGVFNANGGTYTIPVGDVFGNTPDQIVG